MKPTSDLKTEIERYKKMEGKIRGATINTEKAYILQREGKEGLEKLKKELSHSGYQINYSKIETLGWYPEGYSIATLLGCKKVFGWNNEDIFQTGIAAPKTSFFVKLISKYFISPKKAFNKSQNFWNKVTDFPDVKLIPVEFSSKKKTAILRVTNYRYHPVGCKFHSGYFTQVAQYSTGEEVNVEETKCIFRGDNYHQHKLTW